MADFDKLKSYLSESKGSNLDLQSKFNTNTFMGFFKKAPNESQNLDQLGNSETDSWFKEAENDPFCPKLVCLNRLF